MKVGSLFTGIGGLDLALEAFGHEVIWQADNDPCAWLVLGDKWPGVRRYNDVREIDAKAERTDIICGGFPCQDISVAGAGAGIDGERSGLWSEYARIVRALKPRIVFIENVAALASRGLDRVLRDLAEIGFDAEWDCFTAAEVGAPHKRERLFVLAYSDRDAVRELAERDQGRGRGIRAAERGNAIALDDRRALADAAGARREDANEAGDARGDEGQGRSTRRGLQQPERGGGLADADGGGQRALERQLRARQPDADRRSSRDVAHADSAGRGQLRRSRGDEGAHGDELDGRHRPHLFPPGPDRIAEWPGPQPAVRRGDARVPVGLDRRWRAKNRTTDRLRLLGNACVPQQAAIALSLLAARVLAVAEVAA